NTIYNNTITNNSWHGIYLYSGSSNTIYNNTITNNSWHGIYLSDSNNTISNNTITNNGDGIWLYGSGSNMISGNYFIENRQQIGGDPSGNYWNTTEGGNYWSDYTGDDLNGDGIGDIPYRQDQKPLIVDLMIENLTVTSSTIQVNVRNNGKADITKIDPNAKFPVKITYDSTEYLQYLNSLTPGGEQTITQNITASPGTHNITANILYNETTHYLQNTTIRDANTANNIKNTTKEFKTNITANNLNVTPTSGVAPLNVTVSCKLTNTGEVAGDYTAELKINSAVVDSQTVTVGAGETKTVTFTRTLEAGTYNITIDDLAPTAVTVLRPANITASNLTVTPTSGVAPLNVTASCTLTNTGDVAGDYTAELMINGIVVANQTVTVGAGETKTVTFNRTLGAGTYNVTIDGLAPIAVSVTPAGVSLGDLVSAANMVKAYHERYGRLPSRVVIVGQNYTMSQLLYLLTKATVNINVGNLSPIAPRAVGAPTSPSGSYRSGRLYKSAYVQVAANILSFIDSYGRAPNYASTSLGRIPFQRLVYMYTKIIAFYGTYHRLPNYVTI
ncbi:MAG TPA: pseudomurein-binding repeat-containing protein, partial [Methanothermobacter sp.]|nr:pseudomurein-binding repeat-containing protein [Methanothermobacter sp.]